MIKIKTSRGYLNLGDQFSLDIEETNPVMNDRGSQSIPVTVPASPQNAKCFGQAHRVDMASRPLADDDSCTISDGVYMRTGKIHLVSAGRKEGYEFNIGLDNATAYSAWRATKLNALTLPTYAAGSVSALCQRMQDIINGSVSDADYAVFQVIANVDSNTTEVEGVETTTLYPDYLNELTVADPSTDVEDWTAVSQTLVWAARTKTMLIDSEEVQVSLPDGYGVAPFLYVWKVLELVFSAYGYTLQSNPFHTDATLRHLVILNNAADCCCTGTLDYADLMPDCTVEDFLNALYAKFGMVFETNSNTLVARIMFIKDLVSDDISPEKDYTLSRIEEPLITYEDAKQVKLSSKCGFEGAAPPDERYETFIKSSSARIRSVARVTSQMAQPSWIMFERCTGKMWKYDETNEVQAHVGSSNFNWDRGTSGVSEEDISSPDEMLPMDFAPNGILNPMYLAGLVHRYTEIKSSDVDVSEENENASETPLSFCFGFMSPRNCYTFGSPLIHTPFGDRVQMYRYISIKEDSLCTKRGYRIYGDSASGVTGNILYGDLATNVLAFEVNEGDKIRLTGLMNSPTNPSICWAVYDTVIDIDSGEDTTSALRSAFISGASDPSYAPGRTDVGVSLTMPEGAKMLLVSISASGDTSTVSSISTSSTDSLSIPEHTLLWQFSSGLFAHFWKGYDAVLRHANNQVEVSIASTPADIMQMDILDPVSFMGQNMLIDKVNYSLPSGKKIPVDMTFRTLRLIRPYDLDSEQSIQSLESAEGNTYRWEVSQILPDWDEAARAESIRAEYEETSGVTTVLNSYELVYTSQTPDEYIAELLPPEVFNEGRWVTLRGRTVCNITAYETSGLDTFEYAGSFPPDSIRIYISSIVDT